MARSGQARGVQETMESARRWSGYVCPDCRFVFRIPRDHDGKGVVCPSCRRMLKIPTPEDRPPPLLTPLRTLNPIEPAAVKDPTKEPRRRKKRSRQSEGHAWDISSGTASRSRRGERRQMSWMLIGGGTLLALIVGGLVVAMLNGDTPPNQAKQPARELIVPTTIPAKAPAAPASEPPDSEFLAAVEPVARKFLEAGLVEEMLPAVRNPEEAEPRMKLHYHGEKIEAPGLSKFNSSSEVVRSGKFTTLTILTRNFDEKALTFVETPQGLKIDWESWVGWSNMPWRKFIESKPSSPQIFRLILKDVDYYNFGFSNDRKWQSYLLESPDAEFSVYGYAERGTQLNSRLRLQPDVKRARIMLALKYPADATSSQQVLIERVIADGWVTETEESP